MKKLTFIIATTMVLCSCGPSREELINIKYKEVSTDVEAIGYNNIKIVTVKHDGQEYIVATHREGICIIPKINFR